MGLFIVEGEYGSRVELSKEGVEGGEKGLEGVLEGVKNVDGMSGGKGS